MIKVIIDNMIPKDQIILIDETDLFNNDTEELIRDIINEYKKDKGIK